MRLKTSAYLVLGMLRFGAGSGYAIKKAADISARFFWTTSLAQVYPDLARLEEQGLVTRREEPRGARPRSVYKVTNKGEQALLQWLASSREQAPQYRDEGVLRLFFADALAPEQQRALVRRLAERARRGEQQIRGEIIPIAQAMAENGPRFPAITARLGADLFGFAADWMERLEQELAAPEG
jgi:PadR family transcriptional regulator, regulatory protein AphA